jgi:hypothetical protein
MLDLGVIAHVRRPIEGRVEFDWWPEFDPTDAGWEVLALSPDNLKGWVLTVLYFGLGAHLSQAAVTAPDLQKYLPPLRSWPMWREGTPES